MKKTTKENPITTFRKNFEARSKTVMSSLKKAQNGISVNDEMSDDLINKAGSTGGYKKSIKKYYPWDNVNIANRNRLTEMQGQMVPDFKKPMRDANLEAEGIDKINRLNQMYPNYPLDPHIGGKMYTRDPKINPPPTRVKAKGGPVKKYEPGGSISSDSVGKNRIVHKSKMYGTDKSGNDFVGKRKTVYNNIGTKDNPVVSNQRSRSKITKTDAVTGDQKTIVTKTNSDGKMTTRNALFAVKQKIGGSVKYKTGGAAKATKFAALAKPFNKATAADRIAGAKKNASKKK